jgi:uncharacterized phiE125 gp8 family phage protein
MADLTSVENVKEWLGLDQNTDDLLLSRLVSGVSAWVEQYIGRAITAANYDEYYTCRGESIIPLRHYPVTAITSVTVDGAALAASTGYGISGYAVDGSLLVYQGGAFSTPGNTYFRNVRVQYTAGHTTIPKDLEQAVIHLVALRYRERDRIGQKSKILAGETVYFSVFDLPPDVKSILDNYKDLLL